MEGNTHLLQVIRKMRSQINKLERENRALRAELQVCGQKAAPPERGAAGGGGNGGTRSLANDGGGPSGSPASLHGSIMVIPAPSPKEQTDTTMTVRRYSTTSPVPAPASVRFHRVGKRPPSNGLPASPGSAQPPACPDAAQLTSTEEKRLEKTLANCLSNSHSGKTKLFQEYVNKCRATHPQSRALHGPSQPPQTRPGAQLLAELLEETYVFLGKVKAVSFFLPMDMSSYAENQGSLKSPQNQSTKQLTTITGKDM